MRLDLDCGWLWLPGSLQHECPWISPASCDLNLKTLELWVSFCRAPPHLYNMFLASEMIVRQPDHAFLCQMFLLRKRFPDLTSQSIRPTNMFSGKAMNCKTWLLNYHEDTVFISVCFIQDAWIYTKCHDKVSCPQNSTVLRGREGVFKPCFSRVRLSNRLGTTNAFQPSATSISAAASPASGKDGTQTSQAKFMNLPSTITIKKHTSKLAASGGFSCLSRILSRKINICVRSISNICPFLSCCTSTCFAEITWSKYP